MKKSIAILLVILLFSTMILGGCGSTAKTDGKAEKSDKTYTIKVATWFAQDHPQIAALTKFKEIVESKSQGKIKVQIYPNSQLGSEETYIDSVKNGTVEMGVTGTMPSKFHGPVALAEMPFLFDGWEHAYKVFMGPIADEIGEPLKQKAGFRTLAWTVNGFRVFSSRFEINDMGDFKGMRLRVPNVPNYVKMAEGLGANPVALAFNELFTALEQKVVDGQDNPYATVRASSFYEVQPYMLHSHHMFSPAIWIFNEKLFQSMSKEYQDIITSAAKEAAEFNWKSAIEKEKEDMEFLKSKGIKIHIPDENFKAQMRESQKAVEEWYYEKYPETKELVKKIRAVK